MYTANTRTNEQGTWFEIPKIGTGGFGDSEKAYKVNDDETKLERITLKQFCIALSDHYFLEQFINENRLASKIKTYLLNYHGIDKNGDKFKYTKGIVCKFTMYKKEFTAISQKGSHFKIYLRDKQVNNIHSYKD